MIRIRSRGKSCYSYRGIASENEAGFGAAGVLMLFAGVAVTWWIFLSIMDVIKHNHSAKVKERMDRFRSYKKSSNIDSTKRTVRGFTVTR